MAALSLFVVLGGTSYAVATGSIDSREFKNGTVRSKDVKNKTLLGRDFRSDVLPRWALVSDEGKLIDKRGVDFVRRDQEGGYIVNFNGDVNTCAAVATATATNDGLPRGWTAATGLDIPPLNSPASRPTKSMSRPNFVAKREISRSAWPFTASGAS